MKPDKVNIYKAYSLSKAVFLYSMYKSIADTHQNFTCSSSTIETLEKGLK